MKQGDITERSLTALLLIAYTVGIFVGMMIAEVLV